MAVKICVTGAAGQIAYSLFPHLCSGATFGANQSVILHLLDIEPAKEALAGVKMELEDAAYPLLAGVVCTTDVSEAFTDIDYCIMLGAFPRKQGMERKDLLKMNAGIFKAQGAALNNLAKKTVKVVVVGNPANTNCLIAKSCAPDLPAEAFSALTRLDHNRAKAQVALKVGVSVEKVKNTIIWGNHSSTQYPDVNHATVDGKAVRAAVNDDAYLNGDEFIGKIQKRGAAIINARKLSSALSAAAAIRDHMRDWVQGTPDGEFVSMGVWSTGKGYGIPDGLIYSYPVTCKNGTYSVVADLPIDAFSREKMDATAKELAEELADAKEFLG
jgi:malate dehydrogenase